MSPKLMYSTECPVSSSSAAVGLRLNVSDMPGEVAAFVLAVKPDLDPIVSFRDRNLLRYICVGPLRDRILKRTEHHCLDYLETHGSVR